MKDSEHKQWWLTRKEAIVLLAITLLTGVLVYPCKGQEQPPTQKPISPVSSGEGTPPAMTKNVW
jgi:hypothetical protein